MPISKSEFLEMEQRTIRNRRLPPESIPVLEYYKAVDEERKLHDQIITHCNNQWPKWKFIHARMDKRSTIEEGAQDFTVFLPGGKTLCIECKAKNRKLSPEQLAWKLEMERLSHGVHTVRSMDEFLRIANQVNHHDTTNPGSNRDSEAVSNRPDNEGNTTEKTV